MEAGAPCIAGESPGIQPMPCHMPLGGAGSWTPRICPATYTPRLLKQTLSSTTTAALKNRESQILPLPPARDLRTAASSAMTPDINSMKAPGKGSTTLAAWSLPPGPDPVPGPGPSASAPAAEMAAAAAARGCWLLSLPAQVEVLLKMQLARLVLVIPAWSSMPWGY